MQEGNTEVISKIAKRVTYVQGRKQKKKVDSSKNFKITDAWGYAIERPSQDVFHKVKVMKNMNKTKRLITMQECEWKREKDDSYES